MPKSRIPIGLTTPAADDLNKGELPPHTLTRPLFAPFSQIAGDGVVSPSSHDAEDPATLFEWATDKGERCEVFLHALATKLARAISVTPNDVGPRRPLSDYGVDSLMAVELRNWTNRDFYANVSVFDIIGITALVAIADLEIKRSRVGKNT